MHTEYANQQDVNEYFESRAAYWKNVYSDDTLMPAIYQDRHSTALGWIHELGLQRNARILEIGCGAGLMSIALARDGYTVDALDSTTAMTRMTRKNATDHGVQERIRIHSADVHALPFAAQTFDLVIAIGVIPWLHSERVALQEMRRVLKPGGHLLVTADNNARLNRLLDPLSSPMSLPLRFAAKSFLRLLGLWSWESAFRSKRHYPGELNRIIRECRFMNLKCGTVGFGPFTLFGKALLADALSVRLHRLLQTLSVRWGAPFLRWTGSHYVVLATKV
jgi:ubiquinone/menaquinone biosynthesis C-methylase UbiE